VSLTHLLRRDDAESYTGLGDSARAEFDALYWSLLDPLRLTPVER